MTGVKILKAGGQSNTPLSKMRQLLSRFGPHVASNNLNVYFLLLTFPYTVIYRVIMLLMIVSELDQRTFPFRGFLVDSSATWTVSS